MPGYVGFQLSLDVASLFPAAISGVSTLIDYARSLRTSGSDIVVEADLAEIFGRGRVSVELERKFKTEVKIQKFTPLYQGSGIELHQGPGPTMLHAFQEPRYFATVLTLSMLSAFMQRRGLRQ
jgi:hypothetical protein